MLILLLALFPTVFSQCFLGDDAYIGGLCYTTSNYKTTYQTAQLTCHWKSQNLAVIQNSLQANYLASLVHRLTNEQDGKFWIGLSRQSVGSRYQWDDGTPLTWSNFDSKYTQNKLNVVESTTNGKWQTVDVQESHYFVCSYDPSKYSTTLEPPSTYYPDSSTVPPVSESTYYPWSTDYPDVSTSYPPYGSTDYPWGTTDYPWGTTDYPWGTTDYPWGTTDYPSSDSTDYPWWSTNYPPYGSTDYPDWSTTYSPFGTTDYPMSSRFNKVPNSKSLKKLLRL
ncbi:hypothetical protein CRE_24279 [Caenorhabditis remanei]|uniref:C-type lectin domain-containing protein n=1 Tax=Caenorhabditis remanei TaxID=31234 RepID=E3NJW0_CAERE|nr:hypothetical protein CRE_24279 [Caenorhabditis remanei]